LEYLPVGSPDCPLLRLFDFTSEEAEQLRATIADLAKNRTARVVVHELPGVTAVDECKLVMAAQGRDQAVVCVGPLSFECGFTTTTWDNVAGLIEPFTTIAGEYQWLAGAPGEVSLLLSVSGQW
jgi:hypothetical protein